MLSSILFLLFTERVMRFRALAIVLVLVGMPVLSIANQSNPWDYRDQRMRERGMIGRDGLSIISGDLRNIATRSDVAEEDSDRSPSDPRPSKERVTVHYSTQQPNRAPDVIFVPTPQEVVDAMLKVAKVTENDIVYDLGSGDGRIPVTAARVYGARAVGIDIDPERIAEANANAEASGVTDKVKFLNQDLFTTDFSEATVVTLYLLPSLNRKLQPKLMEELKPGTRIVSHAFDMGDWEPELKLNVGGRIVYLWTIP